jgi:hypothetical protein
MNCATFIRRRTCIARSFVIQVVAERVGNTELARDPRILEPASTLMSAGVVGDLLAAGQRAINGTAGHSHCRALSA